MACLRRRDIPFYPAERSLRGGAGYAQVHTIHPSSAAGTAGASYRFGEVLVDFRRAEVTRGGQTVELSAREFRLLRHFVQHRGATLSRQELLNEVWGYDAMPLTRTVDVHVAGLRQKLEANPRRPQYLLTVHGLGYRFIDRP